MNSGGKVELKRTPLYETHRALGARLVGFAGWEMPVIYSGVIAEHLGVRSSCGLFDVSHMGEIEVIGKGAMEALQRLATNDVEKALPGQCQYTLMCYPDGGVVDDIIVYCFGKERFLLCVNASNTDKVFEWMRENTLA
ncbi:MAG: glycine cleavage system aminomethyltransferase GcvT, partial [Deltaproteobacteria bacterium]|nr:glycine cleavage system aminomethyltransferase GcvT [Deltaproteobacteria bacterium]